VFLIAAVVVLDIFWWSAERIFKAAVRCCILAAALTNMLVWRMAPD
jgi:hypothetical protein